MKLYKLKIHSPFSRFRLGSDSLDTLNDTIHSDTLFSALVNVCAGAFGGEQAELFVQSFKTGEIIISLVSYGVDSASKEVLFFPRPSLPFKEELTNAAERKKYKKLRWVSQGALTAILASYNEKENWFNWQAKDEELTYSINKHIVASKTEIDGFIPELHYTNTNTKVALDRVSGGTIEGMLYYQTDLLVPHKMEEVNPFLYFFANISIEWATIFNTCINLLADTGIGGERSTGCGQFNGTEIKHFANPYIQSKHCMEYTLSLISPVETDLANLVAYDIMRRGGGYDIEGNEHQSLNMIKEGAIVKAGVRGSLCNVSQNKKIAYRNGINCSIKF